MQPTPVTSNPTGEGYAVQPTPVTSNPTGEGYAPTGEGYAPTGEGFSENQQLEGLEGGALISLYSLEKKSTSNVAVTVTDTEGIRYSNDAAETFCVDEATPRRALCAAQGDAPRAPSESYEHDSTSDSTLRVGCVKPPSMSPRTWEAFEKARGASVA